MRGRKRAKPCNSIVLNEGTIPAGDGPPAADAKLKKPYKPPQITEYGNVTRLTAGMHGSHFDMHNMPTRRDD
jgi:hypothetical protein